MILTRDDGTVSVALQPSLAERAQLLDAGSISLPDLRTRLAASGIVLVRRVTEADRDAFDRFYRSASPQDRDDAWVEFDHAAVFGSFDGDRLVCAASMVPWPESPLADLGVLTLPDARGRGHARAVIAAIADHAVTAGYEPQYRCQTDNRASVALARSAGFGSLGQWEVIRPFDD
nr:GNAT family N-acetyltransferase [Sphingomonas sp. JXJ CY 53]